MPLKIGCVGYGKTTLLNGIIKEMPENVSLIVVDEPFKLELKEIFGSIQCETTHEANDIHQELVDKAREFVKINPDGQ